MPEPTFPTPRPRPLLLVLAGPSGAGKSSLIGDFLGARADFVVSVSATTRAPRGREVDGIDYHFMSPEVFAAERAAGGFLESAQVFGKHWYGTPRRFVADRFAAGQSVIMDIDVQGAAQIRLAMPEAVQVFVLPPSMQELRRRLETRATESQLDLQARLREAEAEIRRIDEFAYLLINDSLARASADLQAIARAEALRNQQFHQKPSPST